MPQKLKGMEIIDNTDEVLELASEAGHVLLQNGAEISRVEDTMARIASHFGVESGNFFVLSNGIFTTSTQGRYAMVEFIPIRAIQLSKVVAKFNPIHGEWSFTLHDGGIVADTP